MHSSEPGRPVGFVLQFTNGQTIYDTGDTWIFGDMALIQELNAQGKTIVFVTHEPDIAAFSSRTVMLKDGKVVKDSINENRRSAKDVLAETRPR